MKFKPILWILFVAALALLAVRGSLAMLAHPAPILAADESTAPPTSFASPATDNVPFAGDDTAQEQSDDNAALPIVPRPETLGPGPVKPANEPSNAKSDDIVPATTERPIRPIRKTKVRVKDVPVQVQVKQAEVHFTETYPLKNQDVARIAAELKKAFPLLQISHDAKTESVIVEVTPETSKAVLEAIQRLSAARVGIPDLSGKWIGVGAGWGIVELRQVEPGVFQGNYSDTFSKKPGTITLRWSAEHRRFNGEWSEGNDRFGELVARLSSDGQVISGAFFTDAKSKVIPGNPKLADFQWVHADFRVTENVPGLPATGMETGRASPHTRYIPLLGPMTWPPTETSPSLAEAQKRYREAEEQARGHGLELRSKVPPGKRTPDELQSLTNTVTTAFDARQELLRLELADFRSRFERLAKTLEARERDKNAIIQHRVEELLNPNLRWDASGSTTGASRTSASTSSTSGTGSSTSVGPRKRVAPISGDGRSESSAPPLVPYEITREKPQTKIFRLKFAKCESLATTLGVLVSDETFSAKLSFDEVTNTVIAVGTTQDIELIESIVNALDQEPVVRKPDAPQLPNSNAVPSPILPQPASPAPVRAEKVVAKIFRLEQVNAASVAKTLQELASEKPFSARISADAASNSVIVFANPDDMHVIEAIIIRIDKAPESATPETSGTSNTAKRQQNLLSSEMKLWQGRWLLVSAEINGQEQKRDEVSTQVITVSGNALKIASRHPKTKEYADTDGVLKLSALSDGAKAFTFEMSSPLVAHELATEVGEDRVTVITYQMPSPLNGSYEFREGKLAIRFYEQGSKNTKKRSDKFKTTPDSGLHLYIFDKVAEPDAINRS